MGFCDIPKVNHMTAVILLIVNIVLPGIGTLIGGIINEGGCDCCMVVCGIVQSCLTACLVGWIWSIWWGIKMVNK
ncbi:hypothetical protein AV274_1303 [Blastocystis sp. ATCC 50177/Nand II]|uniref:Transmembrane protein n=1 Tax=Blastocystis sp. subtype 1 (strain ATCC 50177 / NandII) TaxID=478820 RepID=A0A196SGP7_BLAHN|nr:hypothetical protein AV274_2015 [Blastocystis sp. ATCC 50177/Nand II]OAO16949.1 hypothetical protein AV274_1303 [Blastocystis sp. ATCC 50177/Nand II]